jgi:hypothetical protein
VASGAAIRARAEAGRYSIVVTPIVGASAGPFEIAAAFTADPDTMCSRAAAIGPSDHVTGRLAPGSCRLPDGGLYEPYTLQAWGGGALDIAVDTAAFTPYLIVRGSDGRTLASAEGGRLSTVLDAGLSYTLLVSTGEGGSGDYTLATTLAPAEDERCPPARTLTGTDEDAGFLATEGCVLANPDDAPDAGPVTSYVHYPLQVSESGVAELLLTAATFDPDLRLLDASGTVIATGARGASRGQVLVRRYLLPGAYTVLVSGRGAEASPYNLRYRFDAGPPPETRVIPLEDGASAAGTLSDADLYRIVTATYGTLEIEMSSTRFTPLLALRDEHGNRIVADETGNGAIAADLPAGTYIVVAATADTPGDYELVYRFAAHDPPACPPPLPLDAGYASILGTPPCKGANGQPVDWYEFTTAEPGVTALTLTSLQLRGDLVLTDSAGAVVRQDVNGLGGGDALIVQLLPAGTWRVGVRGADGTPAGYYRLLRYFAPGPLAGCRPQRSLADGDAFDAFLNFTACQYPDGTFADIYRLEAPEAAVFEIAMDSADLDASLVILDGKAGVVAAADGAGVGSGASLRAALDGGVYWVVAKSVKGYTGGAYRLSARRVE